MEEETQAEQTEQMTESSVPSPSDIETAHIDAAIEDLERQEKQEAQKAAVESKKAEIKELDGILMGSDEFCDLAAGGMTFVQALTHLQALDFDEQKQAQARDAYGALYEVIRDCPSVRWILNPASEKALRYWRIGSFFVPVTLAVVGELRARRLERTKRTVQTVKTGEKSYSVEDASGGYNFAAMAEAEKKEREAAA